MRKKALLIALLLVGLCVPFANSTGKAWAVLECCPWPFNIHQNYFLELSYTNSGDSYLAPLIDNGASAWSSTSSPPIYYKNCVGGCVGTTSVGAGNPQCGYCGGWTSYSGNPRTSASIVLNEGYLKASPAPIAQALVVHEFGHATGLWHSDGTNCHSVMYSYLGGSNPYTLGPSGYDVSEVNRMYPNPNWQPSGAC